MELKLLPIENRDLIQFKNDMQESFQLGAEEGGYPTDGEIILPEEDIDHSLDTPGMAAYKAVLDGRMVGGAIVVINPEEKIGHLDFLYVKHGMQGKGVGKFIWYEIEKIYPEIKVWETCTPYFEKRNIHFYVNVCKFHIVEFINKYHKNPDEEWDMPDNDGMFEFQKILK